MIRNLTKNNIFFHKVYKALKNNVFLYKLNLIFKEKQNLLVDTNTDICINGYPRSGNTFLTVLLDRLTEDDFKIAHHTHTLANFKLANKYNTPTIILIRNPLDSVASFMVRKHDQDIQILLQDYITFYNYVNNKLNEDNFLIVSFETLTSDLEFLLNYISNQFNISLNIEDYSNIEELEKDIFNIIKNNTSKWENKKNNDEIEKGIAIPSSKKEDKKSEYKNIIKSMDLYDQAYRIYNDLYKI